MFFFTYGFLLSINRPTIAIAMIMATTPIARYIARVFVLTFDAVDDVAVGAGVDVAVGVAVAVVVEVTVAYVDACDSKYELLPAKLA